MFIVEVIPLTTLPPNAPQILSYFFNKKLERGAVVQGVIGNRTVKAIVIGSTPLTEHKIGLRKAEFQLKKLSEVLLETPQVSSRQIKIALWLSKTYYAPLGMCLKAVLPPFFLKKKYSLIINPDAIEGSGFRPPTLRSEQAERRERKPGFMLTGAKSSLKNILPLIRSTVNNGSQAAIITPDNQTLKYFYQDLSKNFKILKISSEISNKILYESWQSIQNGETQIVVGTRQALLCPFKKLGLIIVDDPLHESYKSDMTPKYNTPDLAAYIAMMNPVRSKTPSQGSSADYASEASRTSNGMNNCRLICLSPVIGVENYFRVKNNIYELIRKTTSSPEIKTINMVSEIKSGNFSIFSREFKNQILSLINPPFQNKRVLIFSPRRGYSGIIVCQNCGFTAKCPNCDAAYRIHRAENLILMCHHCGNIRRLPDRCSNCNSCKLKPTGPAGSQKIYEEVRKILYQNQITGVPVLILDADVTVNRTEEEEAISEIIKSQTSILIATQMIFSYRYDIDFDFIAVMNTDSMIQAPDFRTEERLLYQIEKLFDFNPKNFLIQTYNPENQAILTASQRNYNDFYEQELAVRQAFSYPPFSRLIKLTFKHYNRDKASKEARVLAGKLKMAAIQLGLSDKIKITDSAPGFMEKERGLYSYNIIIKSLASLSAYPAKSQDQTLREILKFVPPRWLIDVDPKSLL